MKPNVSLLLASAAFTATTFCGVHLFTRLSRSHDGGPADGFALASPPPMLAGAGPASRPVILPAGADRRAPESEKKPAALRDALIAKEAPREPAAMTAQASVRKAPLPLHPVLKPRVRLKALASISGGIMRPFMDRYSRRPSPPPARRPRKAAERAAPAPASEAPAPSAPAPAAAVRPPSPPPAAEPVPPPAAKPAAPPPARLVNPVDDEFLSKPAQPDARALDAVAFILRVAGGSLFALGVLLYAAALLMGAAGLPLQAVGLGMIFLGSAILARAGTVLPQIPVR